MAGPKLNNDVDTDWMADAACLGMDPDIFHPRRGATSEEAKRTCAGCAVRSPCLEYALTLGLKQGIYGGTTDGERRKIRIQRNRTRR